ncbi:hypothetical protein [Streptomyces sp. NPDC050145]|uniref:hypothetical protein n=1 Tax=Streptomyces sp. NPDC050145 TaxID=3365602 RepID=UPI0037A11E4A
MTAFLAMVAAGCSDAPKKDEPANRDSGVSARQVCEGALDTAAAEALTRIAGTDRFDELTGTNDAGEPNTFSLRRAVEHLHDKSTARSSCSIYKTGDGSGTPLLEVEFLASVGHPKPSGDNSDHDKVEYRLGVYAATGPNGANLYFKCPSKAEGKSSFIGDTQYVKAQMYSAAGKIHGDDSSRDRMTILNSIARKVADRVGCASTAALPEKLPSPQSNQP